MGGVGIKSGRERREREARGERGYARRGYPCLFERASSGGKMLMWELAGDRGRAQRQLCVYVWLYMYAREASTLF